MKIIHLLICVSLLAHTVIAQNKSQTDSLISRLLNEQVTPEGDEAVKLIGSGNYEGASQFLSAEISKDESDRAAYFKRGVANWALSDTLNACRDWSAVLALGDTEMFNILDSKCHGSMIISEDTIPSKDYHKMWAKKDVREASDREAKTVVDEMPSFPGGQEKLFEYIISNLKHIEGKRGTVYVNFMISPKGKILYPYVAHGLGDQYDKEAIRIVRSMPDWQAGKLKGKAVYVRSSLPVRF